MLNLIKIIASLFCSLALCSAVYATPPLNMDAAKKNVSHYYESGDFNKDVQQLMAGASNYLKYRINHNSTNQKLAVVFDIDDTLISNYTLIKKDDFAQTKPIIQKVITNFEGTAIPEVQHFYNEVKDSHVAIFIITGRGEKIRNHTTQELNDLGYSGWNHLYLRTPEQSKLPAETYKTAVRQSITQSGYTIILNLGDQESDLMGGFSEKTIKIPNPLYIVP